MPSAEFACLHLQRMATINATLATKGPMLKTGTVVDATLIAAPSSTKNSRGERDPDMHQTKKGNQWHFGINVHIGVDADLDLVHTVIGTVANVNDFTQGHGLLHCKETVVFADSGYQGADKRLEATGVAWHVAMHPGKRRALDKHSPWVTCLTRLSTSKSVCAPRGRIPSESLNASSDLPRSATKDWARTQCN